MIKIDVYPGDLRLITIKPRPDFSVTLCSVGASIYEITMPDKHGKISSITPRPAFFKEFCSSSKYFGKSIGRVVGRIPQGILDFNGQRYQLPSNEGTTALHGGKCGFSFQNFKSVVTGHHQRIDVVFTKKMMQLGDGFPGTLEMKVTYRFIKGVAQIELIYEGLTKDQTVFNPSNHVYFNLNSSPKESVLNHELMLKADQVAKLDENLIITGFVPVNRVHDFRKPKKIGQDVEAKELQDHRAYGYDHTYVLLKEKARDFALAATLFSPSSGRRLGIFTDLPTLTFYGGNYPDLNIKLASGSRLTRYHALALEPQLFPRDVKGWTITKNRPHLSHIIYTFEVFTE